MATKRREEVLEQFSREGTVTRFRLLEFATPEDFVDLAVQARAAELRGLHTYEPGMFSRRTKDKFLRLRLNSGLEEVTSGGG